MLRAWKCNLPPFKKIMTTDDGPTNRPSNQPTYRHGHVTLSRKKHWIQWPVLNFYRIKNHFLLAVKLLSLAHNEHPRAILIFICTKEKKKRKTGGSELSGSCNLFALKPPPFSPPPPPPCPPPSPPSPHPIMPPYPSSCLLFFSFGETSTNFITTITNCQKIHSPLDYFLCEA